MESERITISFNKEDIANLEIDTTTTPDLECQHIIWKCIEHLKNERAFNDNAFKHAAMYLHAFGLQLVNPECSDKKQIWLPYWHKFGTVGNGTSKDQQVYKFRVRHRPLGDFNPNSIVGEYLFLQMVDDFLHDPTFPLNNIDDTCLSLLISIALLLQMPLPLCNGEIVNRRVKIEQLEWKNLFKLFGTFSKPLLTALKINYTLKLDKKYWKFYYLRKCVEGMKKKNLSICEWKKIFYGKLLKNFPQYCLEFYQVKPPEYNSPVSAMLKLHCGHNENGLYYGQEKECSMSDIEGMNLIKPKNLQDESWTIIIHLKERAPKVLPFKSEEEAQSFLSMAQGLVKLCVRWDCFMSYNVLTRGEIMDSELRSFGPLKDSTAEAYLYDLSKKPSFSGRGFLIHQSASEYQVYIVLTCTQSQMQGQGQLAYDDLQFKRHRIVLKPEGSLTLEKEGDESKEKQPFWKSVDLRRVLLRQFGLQAQPRDYPRIADINDEYKYDIDPDIGDDAPTMLLARPVDLEREEKLPSMFLPRDLTAEIAIHDKNIKVRKFQVKYKDKAMMKVQVASSDEGEAEALRAGLERLEKLRRFKPQRFLQLYNVVLEHRMTVVMELAPHGDLLTYICERPQSPYDKVELMRQVVDVLQAMHECNSYHGNIRSRKFLIFDDPMTAHVHLKMEFPGVTSLLDTKPLDHKLNLERLPWLSPERQEKLEEVTYESECYSVGTTLAEIVYRTDDFLEPAGVDSYDKLHDFFMKNNNLPPPKSSGCDDLDDLWKNIWDTVILQCWNMDPNLRPLPNKLNHILKDIAKEAEEISEAARKEEVLKMKYEDVCNDEEDAPSMQQLQSLLQQKNNMFSGKGNLTLSKRVGQGHFGKVYKGIWTEHMDSSLVALGINPIQKEVAVKMLKPNRSVSDNEFRNEIHIAAQLEHENIVKVISADYHPDPEDPKSIRLIMITEFMDAGSLDDFLKKPSSPMDSTEAKRLLRMCQDIVKGMVYLSGKDIVHRDLAPRNILLRKLDRLVAKVSDFGLSRTLDDDYRFYRTKRLHVFPWPIWPPECLVENPADQCFSSQGDVWSFGILLWQVFFPRANLIAEMSKAVHKRMEIQSDSHRLALDLYRSNWRPPKHERMSEELYKIMKDCWEESPRDRPKFVDLDEKISRLLTKLSVQ